MKHGRGLDCLLLPCRSLSSPDVLTDCIQQYASSPGKMLVLILKDSGTAQIWVSIKCSLGTIKIILNDCSDIRCLQNLDKFSYLFFWEFASWRDSAVRANLSFGFMFSFWAKKRIFYAGLSSAYICSSSYSAPKW